MPWSHICVKSPRMSNVRQIQEIQIFGAVLSRSATYYAALRRVSSLPWLGDTTIIPLTAIVVKMVLQTAANLLIHGGPTALKRKQRTRLRQSILHGLVYFKRAAIRYGPKQNWVGAPTFSAKLGRGNASFFIVCIDLMEMRSWNSLFGYFYLIPPPLPSQYVIFGDMI